MQQIKQIEENHASAAGILGFFDDFGYSSKSLEKPSMVRSKSFGALFGTSASAPDVVIIVVIKYLRRRLPLLLHRREGLRLIVL